MTDIDIDDAIEIKAETKSPQSLKNSPSKSKAVAKLSDEEKHQMFDTVYDDVYEVVLPNTLWGRLQTHIFSNFQTCILIRLIISHRNSSGPRGTSIHCIHNVRCQPNAMLTSSKNYNHL